MCDSDRLEHPNYLNVFDSKKNLAIEAFLHSTKLRSYDKYIVPIICFYYESLVYYEFIQIFEDHKNPIKLANKRFRNRFRNNKSVLTPWDCISGYEWLSNHFMDRFKHKLNWKIISIYQELDESFIIGHSGMINWKYVSLHQTLSESFIVKHKKEVVWWAIFQKQLMSKQFMLKYKQKVEWWSAKEYDIKWIKKKVNLIPEIKKRTEKEFSTMQWIVEFSKTYEEESYPELDNTILDKYKKVMDWKSISFVYTLNEQFIEDYIDFVDWFVISLRQDLSESFINKHKDRIVWWALAFNHRISKKFVSKHKHKIEWWRVPGMYFQALRTWIRQTI